jgi:hypothetical protein
MRARRRRRLGAAVRMVAVCAICACFGQPAEAQRIGSVTALTPDAFGTPPAQQPDPLDVGMGVVGDELVQTLAAAAVQIRFLDDTDLRIGASSMIVLDRLVYDPDQGVGELVIGIAVGAARFVSGDMSPEGFAIQTPVALIGVRGTDFVVGVLQSGRTTIAVIEGLVIVVPNGRPAVLVQAGQTITIEPDPNIPVTIVPGLIVPDDPGLGPIPAAAPAPPPPPPPPGGGQPGGAGSEEAGESDTPSETLRDPIPSLPPLRPPTVPPSPRQSEK